VSFVVRRSLAALLGGVTLGLLFGAGPSSALEDVKVYRGVLVLEGKIVPGDFDRVRNFLAQRSNFDKISGGVFLASPGGSITQAMRIGRLIRVLRLSTDVPSGPATGSPKFGQSVITPNELVNPSANYLCTSACFFAYVGGIYRNPTWVGRLGIHRPVQLESNAKKLDVDQTLNLNWQVRGAIKKYLEEMNIPDKYVDLIYSVPPNEVRWITQSEFDTDIQGLSPEVKDRVRAKCDQESKDRTASADVKAASMEGSRAQPSDTVKCWSRFKTQLSNEAWDKLFANKQPGQ